MTGHNIFIPHDTEDDIMRRWAGCVVRYEDENGIHPVSIRDVVGVIQEEEKVILTVTTLREEEKGAIDVASNELITSYAPSGYRNIDGVSQYVARRPARYVYKLGPHINTISTYLNEYYSIDSRLVYRLRNAAGKSVIGRHILQYPNIYFNPEYPDLQTAVELIYDKKALEVAFHPHFAIAPSFVTPNFSLFYKGAEVADIQINKDNTTSIKYMTDNNRHVEDELLSILEGE